MIGKSRDISNIKNQYPLSRDIMYISRNIREFFKKHYLISRHWTKYQETYTQYQDTLPVIKKHYGILKTLDRISRDIYAISRNITHYQETYFVFQETTRIFKTHVLISRDMNNFQETSSRNLIRFPTLVCLDNGSWVCVLRILDTLVDDVSWYRSLENNGYFSRDTIKKHYQ